MREVRLGAPIWRYSIKRSSDSCRRCRVGRAPDLVPLHRGRHLPDATATVRALNEQGKLATIDVLGEEITNEGRRT